MLSLHAPHHHCLTLRPHTPHLRPPAPGCHAVRLGPRPRPLHARRPGGEGGDPELQDELAERLYFEMAKQKAKDDILEDLDQRKEHMRKLGEEVGG